MNMATTTFFKINFYLSLLNTLNAKEVFFWGWWVYPPTRSNVKFFFEVCFFKIRTTCWVGCCAQCSINSLNKTSITKFYLLKKNRKYTNLCRIKHHCAHPPPSKNEIKNTSFYCTGVFMHVFARAGAKPPPSHLFVNY
jgi:hypothetical protein